MVIMFDTCQAMSLFDNVEAPNIFLIGTSVIGQSAYSYQFDPDFNQDLNDRFSYYFFYEFLRNLRRNKFTSQTKLTDI